MFTDMNFKQLEDLKISIYCPSLVPSPGYKFSKIGVQRHTLNDNLLDAGYMCYVYSS